MEPNAFCPKCHLWQESTRSAPAGPCVLATAPVKKSRSSSPHLMSNAQRSSSPSLSTSSETASHPNVTDKPSRKSSPPPKLSLDDCSPLISTNTSNNAAPKPNSAFVFTSSRSIRTLHNLPHTVDDARPVPPPTRVAPPSPNAPSGSSKLAKQRQLKKPALSPAQLARHSRGALDARCIVSSSMRAAGFVPLSQTPASHASSGPSTPSLPVPTPMDPPRFPPLVFMNPNNVLTTSLWDYQRTLPYGLPTSSDYTFSEGATPSTRSSHSPVQQGKNSSDSGGSSSGFGSKTDFTSSSSSSFSANAHPSLSSMMSLASHSLNDLDGKLEPRLHEPALRNAPIEGYPFPVTPSRSRTQSTRATSPPRTSTLPASPLMSSSASTVTGSNTPMATPNSATSLPRLPSQSQPRLGSGSGTNYASGSVSMSTSPSTPPASGSRRRKSQLSLTELCWASPSAWLADPMHIVPHTADSKRDALGKRTSDWTVTGGSKKTETETEIASEDRKEVQRADEAKDIEGKAEAVREVLQAAAESLEEDEIAKEKKAEKQRGKEKDGERRRHKGKASSTKSHSSFDSSPTSATASPPRSTKERVRRKGKDRSDRSDRSWSTKSKALIPEPTYSRSSPPRDLRFGSLHRPHVLGQRDPFMEREREREAGQFAKDAVLAHRERDREYARQSHRMSTKVRVASTPTDEFTTVYEAGRGRGLGRGEHGGGRGRGRSVSAVSTTSVLSETETVVQSETSETQDAVESVVPV